MDYSLAVSNAEVKKVYSSSYTKPADMKATADSSGLKFSDVLDSVIKAENTTINNIGTITVPVDASASDAIKELELGLKSQIITRAVEAYKNITEMQI